MRAVQTGPIIGLIGQAALLGGLALTVGVDPVGWAVGGTYGVIVYAGLSHALARHGVDGLRPADKVTLIRATLAGGVAVLTADSLVGSAPVATLVSLTVVALVLDAADGWLARRTDTASALGAHFDMEVDAFLILVLSVYVARSTGAWVLAIGLARYAFLALGRLLPWMRRSMPPRYWCKVVAATAGVVLTVAAADVLPRHLTTAALVVSSALLAESFGREAWCLWRHRGVAPDPIVASARSRSGASARVLTVLAGLLVWFTLVAPDRLDLMTPSAFVRIPLEGLLGIGVLLVLPPHLRRLPAVLAGVLLGLLTIVKVLDMGFVAALGRPFDPMVDWTYLGSAVGLLSDSIGRSNAMISLAAAAILAVAALILVPLSVLRLTRVVESHRAPSIIAVTVLAVSWTLCAVIGLQIVPGTPVASTAEAGLAIQQVSQVRADIQDQEAFAKAAAVDHFRHTPGNELLTRLRGKDVIIAFVESYGRVAVQGSPFSAQVDAALKAGTGRLRAAGFSSRSAFLTSPTFGGISWLAHSTLQSGLWIDSQQRYDELVGSHHFTLSDAFKRAGWRTVADVPSNYRDWPEGTSFYHYDKIYDARNVGYVGPTFGYADMPDQYTLSAFHRLELAKPHSAPVMAEIDLVSSHTPWAPLPRMVDWSEVGNGSVFDGMPEQGASPSVVWRDPAKVKAAYGQSIEYSLSTLVSFVQTYPDRNLVLIVLGDHQPATIVSGDSANHDVPITIIAHDPAVMKDISGWGWQDGMLPGPNAPVWPMDAFRDRFLTAYGP